MLMVIIAMFVFGVAKANAKTVTATGKVDSTIGAYLRKSTSTSSAKVMLLKNNTKLTIKKEIFKKKSSTKKVYRWYYVSVGSKTGYIRSDCVDSISYTTVKCQTTTSLKYRKGAGTKMPLAGTFKKGATVYKAIPVKASGTTTTWYKIRKNSTSYYVCGKYIKEVDTSNDPIFTLSNIVKPSGIQQGTAFSISGVIKCNKTIQKAKVGVVDTKGNWKISKTETVEENNFNIATVDADIKFGSLETGSYYYRCDVTVDGKTYKKINSAFSVKIYKGGKLLGDTAIKLAWPLGTSSSKYAYPSGNPVEEYKNALYIAFGTKWSEDSKSKAGVSCDIFVSTVCRYSGYDKDMPKSTAGIYTHCASSSKWKTVDYHYKESELQHGDIIVYEKDGGKHSFMYVVSGGVGCIAKAAYNYNRYPYLLKASGQRPVTGKDTKNHKVFRATN